MSERDGERLFEAYREATSRSLPELDHDGVRRRVLEAHARAATPRAFPLAYRLTLAGMAVLVATVVVMALKWPAPATFQVAGKSGAVGAWLDAQAAEPLALSFSEGTTVALGAGSRGRVARVSRGGAHIELAKGSVKAQVKRRPGADWTFGAGPFEVSVLGTELDVSWQPHDGKFELSVSRGSVLLRGPLIPDAQEVRAGQVCRVDLTRRLMTLARVTATEASSQPEPRPPQPAAAAPQQPAPAEAPSAAASTSPGSPRGATPESLLELAAEARQAGRRDEERAALLACRKRAPGQPTAAQAAYLLGRASAGAEAAQWFETYLREQPNGLLSREASGRLIESHSAAGNSAAATQAAARYLARYPHGPHASMARRTLGGRSESQD